MNADKGWHQRAACAGEDVNVFFPEDYPGRTSQVEAHALETCAACPVRLACLENALAEEHGRGHAGRYGIRGGKRPRQRYGIYRRRQEAAGESSDSPYPSDVRLSDADRIEVGRRRAAGERTDDLVAEYGVSPQYVRRLGRQAAGTAA